MQSDSLLTQDELDFIQKILFTPPQQRCRRAAPQLVLGERLSEFLTRLGNEEQLSLDTHTDTQHLSFPLHLIQDAQSQPRLELGAPLIFEQGVSERPWRLVLPTALALLDGNDQPSGLKALELSNNGVVVEYCRTGTPTKDQLLQLMLPQARRVQLRARLARRVSHKRYAYSLQTLHSEDEQMLRQFLFEQHSEWQALTAALG